MNQDRIQGRWKQFKGRVREHWGRLTDDDLDVIEGQRDQLLGRAQRRHGMAREEAERQAERQADRAGERSHPDAAFARRSDSANKPSA